MEQTVVQYKLVEDHRWSEFINSVNAYIGDGWQPQGGVAIAFNDGGSIKAYVQAIVKREEK